MFRILKYLLFFALLGGLYGLYNLHSAKQREHQVLAWSNRLIWDALSTDATPRFGGQTVAEGPSDRSWRVSGQMAARTAAGTPIEGAYQAIIAQRCKAAEDERCWELQALRVGDEVVVAGPGLLEAQPEPIAEPGSPASTAPEDTAAAPEPAETPGAETGSGQSVNLPARDSPPTGNPPPSRQAEKAVVFGLPPPSMAEPLQQGFSRIAPADDAQPAASAAEAAAQLAMQASPKAKAPPAAPVSQEAAPQPEAAETAPVPQMEAIPVEPVQMAGTLEANTTPAAGQAATEPEAPAPGAPLAAPSATASASSNANSTSGGAGSEQTAVLPQSEAPETAAETAAAQAADEAAAQAADEAAAPARFESSLVEQTQDRLLRLDYGRGRLARNGVYDAATQDAVLSYQFKNGLPGTGEPSYALLEHMDGFLARLNAIASGQAAPTPAAGSRTAFYAPASNSAPTDGGYASFRNGLAAAERGQIDEAIAHYTRAIESTQWRERHMAYLSRGKALAGQGNYRQAINDYSAAIQLRPDYAEAWINRGLAFAELAQRDQALSDLRQGQRLAPGSGTAARALRILESRSQLE